MAEEAKAAVTAAEPVAPVAEPSTSAAPEETKAEEPTAAPEAAEAATETKPAEVAGETAAATEEPAKPAEEAKETKEVKPIYEGILHYASNPLNAIIPVGIPKYTFFFGDEAVPSEKLKHLVKSTKTELAHAVAWSNETGKGLLYYVKDVAQKSSPAGVIALSEVEDLVPKGRAAISFKASGSPHTLKAGSTAERDGWFQALEEKIEEAKRLKDEIIGKDSYKENVDKLGKSTLLGAGAAAAAAPKKSFEDRNTRSKSTDKERKDRSQSRGKRFFENFRGKKEEPAKEEAKEPAAEEAKPEAAEAATEAPAEATEVPEAAEAAVAETAAAPVEETKAKEEAPAVKASRRGSKLIDLFRGAISPTREKKPEDLTPPPAEAAVAETAPVIPAETIKTEEPAAEAATEPAAATDGETKPAEEAAGEAPAEDAAKPAEKQERRRSSFFETLQSLRKSDKAQKKGKAPETTEEPAAETEEAEPAEDAKAEEPTAEATEAPVEAKKEVPPKKENKLIGLLRNPSKAIRGNKEARKAKAAAAEKVEESTGEAKEAESKPAEEIPPATSAEPEVKAVEPAPVTVPEPAPIGSAPPSNPTVAATA